MPTIPLRSDAEKKALLNALDALSVVYDVPKLIDPKLVAKNLTSQFRLYVLEEDKGKVEVRRYGRGWGRDVIVAMVSFCSDTAFDEFKKADSFAEVKKALIQSALRVQELFYPDEEALWLAATISVDLRDGNV